MPESPQLAVAPRTVKEALAPRTVKEALALGTKRLAAAGCDTPGLDAELLLADALDHGSRARLVLDAQHRLDGDALSRYEQLLARREGREPVAYILGRKWFRGIRLAVDGRVLIPRPETELLVEIGLSLPAGSRVADVGTGSGAVALALKLERPDLVVTGIDSSEDALAVARDNRDRLGADVEFVTGDLLDGRQYDAVLANLPYVSDNADLAPEIALFEPPAALYAGTDGLEVVRRLTALLGVCTSVTLAALEVGPGHARAVGDLLCSAGFARVGTRRDLAGHERVVLARR